MSPQPPTPGANAAAAAPDVQEAGAPAPSPAPAGETPSAAPAAAAEAQSGTAPAGESPAAPPPASTTAGTTRTADAAEEGIGVAAAVGTEPGTKTRTGVDSGRPRTPVLAAAAFVGAALVAIPLLLVGSADDDGPENLRTVAGGADTVLDPDSAPATIGDYVAEKPSASPSTKKPKPVESPKVTAPQPRTSSPAPQKPKPRPKATPKPNWSTTTIAAPSVLEVNQAWTTNRIRVVMQNDGNLVVLNERGKPVWASMTFGPNHRAIFQPDGNLVIHNGDDRPIWASKTHDHPGARLVLRPDAKVAVVHNGKVVWST